MPNFFYSKPSHCWEFSRDINDIPIMDVSKADDDQIQCFCQNNSDDSTTIQCATCGKWSHLRCYMLNEKNTPEKFVCLSCQHKLRMQICQTIKPDLEKIHHKLEKITPSIEYIASLARNVQNDAFSTLYAQELLSNLSNGLQGFLDSAKVAWADTVENINHINSITKNDVIGLCEDDKE